MSAHDPLSERLSSISRDVPPPRDLWPGIARAVTRIPRRSWPLALAATLASACLATAVTWVVIHSRGGSVPPHEGALHAPSFEEPTDAHYVAARAALEQSYRERMGLLDPATRVRIERSLEIIRAAHEDIRKALAADPASPLLEELLQSTVHDELDLYDQVVRATQPAVTRT